MSRLSNALLGGGVFAVVFVGSSLLLTYMSTAKNRPIELAQVGGPANQALAIFGETRMRALPGRRAQPDDPQVMEAELQVLRLQADDEGVNVSDDMIAQARSDAPSAPNQVKLAELPGKNGGRLVCASMLIEGHIAHFATTYLPDEIRDPQQAMLPEYILSGCAQAIRDRSRLVTPAEYAKAVIPSLPAGRQYASVRKDFENLANSR